MTRFKILILVLVGLILILSLVTLYGASRWNDRTEALYANLEAARLPIKPTTYHPEELAGLPAPVQRYFRVTLTEGQPIISAVSVEHKGTFNLGQTNDQWRPFTSKQRVITHRPGFVWDGSIQMIPGMPVRVHDAYIAGKGILHATLLGLVSLMNMPQNTELARGELMRYFAEAPGYPTALLPSQGVHWEAINDTSAKATLTDDEITLTMLFRFNEDGLIDSVRAEDRGRAVNGGIVPTPWEGRWWNYELRDGMRVPLEGEVAWLLPEGRKPYWRGRVTSITYETVS